jgi:helix-turn-helix protein
MHDRRRETRAAGERVSAKVEAMVAKHSKLRGSAKTVLLAIARLAPRDDGGGVYASVETIAKQSGWSVDTARRAFRKARDNDELAVYYNRGPKGTNHYQVRVDVLTKRDTNPNMRLATKAPPANCTPRKLQDKGSVFKGSQYSPKAREQDQPLPDSPDAFAEKAAANGYRTCPDCGRYGGRCPCDDSLQASFDRAMRDALDAGKREPAHLASEAALRKAYLNGEPGKVRNVTQAEVDSGWDA